MSRLAALLMFVAWLLYGAMPAVGMPSLPAATQIITAMQDHSGHQGHEAMAGATEAQQQHGDGQQPCPHGGKTCVTPFCAACLTLLPEFSPGREQRVAHSYPTPATMREIVSPGPAPLTPPPRA